MLYLTGNLVDSGPYEGLKYTVMDTFQCNGCPGEFYQDNIFFRMFNSEMWLH
jgi:hypothetical protein